MKIEELRKEIDEVDDELLALLNKRALLVKEVWKLKRIANLPWHDAERERYVAERACLVNKGPLTRPAVIKLFNCIIEQSRRVVAPLLGLGEAEEVDGVHSSRESAEIHNDSSRRDGRN